VHVIVVGAGIIGVCSAYYLRRAGHEVTVIERRAGVAQEASHANAGVIAPGYVAPWAQPGMPGKVLSYLFRAEAPIVFRPQLDPALWRWLFRWLRECGLERYKRNKSRMQRLAFYRQAQLRELRTQHGFDYEQSTGYMQLFRSAEEVDRSQTTRRMLAELGVTHALLDAGQARAIEPALEPDTPLAGALLLPDDETGNCAYFAQLLKDLAITDGVDFRFGVAARSLGLASGAVDHLRTDGGDMRADAYLIAGGVDSLALLRPAGIRLPLLAIKGYSATAPLQELGHAPSIGVMDETYKVAITRLGKRLRIAGTAELGTRGMVLRESALGTLLKVACDWFPSAAVYRNAQFWIGARPMLPDGPPVLGATPVGRLFVSIGHGSSGWAMACGSGRILADLISGRSPEIDLDGLTLDRYKRRRAV
jgi:D-amino-acid dehydrogenase